ncbi:LOW QUALITY PROTEIN: hypothetical protein Ct61P_03388 [Colletotrichum tofieldiae]|nr:LOW QUALITY PROTEIN: hypothetical protein Ct61P_03388 [Colletotrichum tofieldiae]
MSTSSVLCRDISAKGGLLSAPDDDSIEGGDQAPAQLSYHKGVSSECRSVENPLQSADYDNAMLQGRSQGVEGEQFGQRERDFMHGMTPSPRPYLLGCGEFLASVPQHYRAAVRPTFFTLSSKQPTEDLMHGRVFRRVLAIDRVFGGGVDAPPFLEAFSAAAALVQSVEARFVLLQGQRSRSDGALPACSGVPRRFRRGGSYGGW